MASEILNVEMDLEEFNSKELSLNIEKTIKENFDKFYDYCDRLIHTGDSRVEIVDDSFEIESFEFSEQTLRGSFSFSFDSFFYSGCKDIDGSDSHGSEEVFSFIVDKRRNKIVFDEIKLPPAWMPDQAMEDYC